MLYDPKTVSEMTGIPPSTLRRLAVDHAAQLSESARKVGKKRRYTEDDVIFLRRLRAKLPPEVIQSNALAVLPVEITEMFDSFRAQLTQQQNDIEQLKTQVDQLTDALEAERSRSWWDRIRGK